MIYLDEKSEQKLLFENLLQQTKQSVISQLQSVDKPNLLTGSEFELITYENAVLNAQQTPFEGKLVHTADREFPDIVAAGLFGVEVKATKKDDWTSIGNSVLESSRVTSVEKIYMFFGKLGGTPDIKYRNYEDCLKGISVTHYPRYQIDMLLDEEHSIFQKMGTDYDTIRTSDNPISTIRAYYRQQMKEGDALWWIGDDVEEMPSLSPVIKNFSSLDASIKLDIKAALFAYFPEIFSNSSKKYSKIPAYLAAQYGVVMPNVRDLFSAGGQIEVTYEGDNFRVPQVVGELLRLAPKVMGHISGKNREQLENYWQKHIENFTTAEAAWFSEVNKNTAHMELPHRLSGLFTAVLEGRIKV